MIITKLFADNVCTGLFYWGFKMAKYKLPGLQPRLKPLTSHQSKRNWGKGREGRAWRRLRAKMLVRDNYTCQCCGRVGGRLELDHIVNRAVGGTDDKANLQILCYQCHKIKTQSESKAGGVLQFLG